MASPGKLTSLAGVLDLQKNPVDGFSAGLVDDENILEWQIVIMGYVGSWLWL